MLREATLLLGVTNVTYCNVRYARYALFFSLGTEVTMETDITAQILSNLSSIQYAYLKISVFEVVLKYQSQTSYITNMSFGHTFISWFMGCYVHVGKSKYAL
jgi:hypothetical protein